MRVVITGANRGIGLELARQYLAQGHDVVATSRSVLKATELQTLLSKYENSLHLVQLDVTSRSSIDEFVLTVEQLGTVDVLINNAGIYGPKSKAGSTMEEFMGPPRDQLPVQEWLEVFHVNSIAPIQVTTAILPFMADSDHKKIAMISTMMASITEKNYGGTYIYSSSKAALNMVGKSLSNEIARQGFVVTMIHPGWVKTDMGGENADISADVSAAGIIDVIDTNKKSGTFLNYDGTPRPW